MTAEELQQQLSEHHARKTEILQDLIEAREELAALYDGNGDCGPDAAPLKNEVRLLETELNMTQSEIAATYQRLTRTKQDSDPDKRARRASNHADQIAQHAEARTMRLAALRAGGAPERVKHEAHALSLAIEALIEDADTIRAIHRKYHEFKLLIDPSQVDCDPAVAAMIGERPYRVQRRWAEIVYQDDDDAAQSILVPVRR